MHTTDIIKITDPVLLKNCLLKPNSDQPSLGRLVKRVAQIRVIKDILLSWLPKELAPVCQVLNIENGILALAGPSGAVVTRLRYLTPELMDLLNNIDGVTTVRHITFRVMPV